MKIGIDLDNTLVCYDAVFARIGAERGVSRGSDVAPKRALRDALRRQPGGELEWTLAQGEAYGPGLLHARPFPGSFEVIAGWIRAGHAVTVISHKTRFPAVGPAHDFHVCARQWLMRWLGDLPVAVFLETTRWTKLRRIESEQCEVFVDDLLDLLQEPTFPQSTRKIWFSPETHSSGATPSDVVRVSAWSEIGQHLDAQPTTSRREPPAPVSRRRVGPFAGNPAEVFSALVSQHLGTRLVDWEELPGGINNLGVRLTLAAGRTIVGKIYQRSTHDPRDRLRHETSFLRLLEKAGIDCVPRVLAVDEDAGAALHSLVPGARWLEHIPAPAAIWEQFSTFLARLQTAATRPEATELPLAAEAAMSLQEHLGWVQERRDRWRERARVENLPAEFSDRLDELDAACEDVSRATINHRDFQRAIDRTELILTPSDFGLHNALVTEDGRVSFVDFEYAGWDDPVKTECDFTLQPRYAAGRPERLAALDGRFDRSGARTTAIRELLALKWRYIVLAASHARANASASAP